MIVSATTGKAAGNINGVTLHSLVLLPVGKKFEQEKLSEECIEMVKRKFEGKKLLIIDEVSMLSQAN